MFPGCFLEADALFNTNVSSLTNFELNFVHKTLYWAIQIFKPYKSAGPDEIITVMALTCLTVSYKSRMQRNPAKGSPLSFPMEHSCELDSIKEGGIAGKY